MYKFIGIIFLCGCASNASLRHQVDLQAHEITDLKAQLAKANASIDTTDAMWNWTVQHVEDAYNSDLAAEMATKTREYLIKNFQDLSDAAKTRALKCLHDFGSSEDNKAITCWHDVSGL